MVASEPLLVHFLSVTFVFLSLHIFLSEIEPHAYTAVLIQITSVLVISSAASPSCFMSSARQRQRRARL